MHIKHSNLRLEMDLKLLLATLGCQKCNNSRYEATSMSITHRSLRYEIVFGGPSPREAKILQKPKENQCFLPSRLFAFDGLLRPQDGPKMAQESPKTGPREAQDGPKSAQERPKSGPRGPQEATFRAPTGVQ